MSASPRTAGFRVSLLDVVVLIAAIPATWLAWSHLGAMAGIIPLVVGHFFLFCNVFRIHRTKELMWAGVCVGNVFAWAAFADCWWPGILAVQLPLTGVMIVWETRGPWYHGVCACRWNPRLDDYLQGRL